MNVENMEPRKSGATEVSSEAVGTYEWMPRVGLKLCLAVGIMILMVAPLAVGQQERPRPPVLDGSPPVILDSQSGEPAMYQQMRQQRNALRRRKLVEKTQQLQQLSDELRAEVAKTDKDTLSIDVVHKSEQIEKLAKSIHELLVAPI